MTKPLLLFAVLAGVVSAVPLSVARADLMLPVTNYSFEDPVVDPGYQPTLPNGWRNLYGTGTYHVITSGDTSAPGYEPGYPGPTPPDGNQAGWTSSPYGDTTGAAGHLFQRLTSQVIPGVAYERQAYVGQYNQPPWRNVNVQNLKNFGLRIGYTTASGGQDDGYANAVWFANLFDDNSSDQLVANGTFVDFAVSGYAPSDVPAGDVLIVDLYTTGGTLGTSVPYYADLNGTRALFDDVRVSQLPEPASIALLGAGLAGVVTMRRRRRSAG